MNESPEREKQYPFEVKFDEEVDWDDLTIDVQLKGPASDDQKQELENVMSNWADEGIEKGYAGGVMHDWDKSENEWGMDGERLRFWADMGESGEGALDVLFERLGNIGQVKGVRLGSRYDD